MQSLNKTLKHHHLIVIVISQMSLPRNAESTECIFAAVCNIEKTVVVSMFRIDLTHC